MKLPHLINIRYMPRWVTVTIDVSLSFFSIILSYLLRFNFQTQQIASNLFVKGIFATVVVYLAFFIIFRSYKEIIRHTTLKGLLRVFKAVFSATLFLVLLNVVFVKEQDVLVVSYSVLVINFFISFFLLSGSRVFIKKLFDTATKFKKSPIIIFGAGQMGRVAMKTIMQDKLSAWKVVGFIDDDSLKVGKNLAGIPIYNMSQVEKLLKRYNVTRVIIAVSYITVSRRNEIASFFVEHNIKVSFLPANEQWIHDPFRLRQLRDIQIEDLLEREPIQINNNEINALLKGKRILVTGAAGSIGSEIARQAARFNPDILILCDIAESALHTLGLELQENLPALPYKLFVSNITDFRRMDSIFHNFSPDIVFHAAAYKHVPIMEEHPREAIYNNIYGTQVIADLSVKYGVERFVMISTDKAVNPTNVMGASKRIAEMYIQALHEYTSYIHPDVENNSKRKTSFITTRFGNVLGSNGSVIPRFKAQLERGGPITVTHPDITRYFMTIPEACQLVLEAGVMGKGGEIFVFDMGKPIRIAELAKKMIILAGLKLGVDIQISYTGLRPGEKLFEEVLSTMELTMPTYHEKIKIAQVKSIDYFVVKDVIGRLITCARTGNDWESVKAMKEIIPEFKSNNSKFEKLDQQLKEAQQEETKHSSVM